MMSIQCPTVLPITKIRLARCDALVISHKMDNFEKSQSMKLNIYKS